MTTPTGAHEQSTSTEPHQGAVVTDKTPIWITVAINIGGETKTFEADATTGGDVYDVAQGLLSGLDSEAGRWLLKAGRDARRDYA